MPSWKKVILSGSDAALNTLSVSNSITASVISASQFTGSLFGTASWATNVNTASWANNATNASTASWASNVNTASWANNVSTASWASNINTASWAQSASHALNARTASWASNVNTASWANNVSTASWASNINTASWASNALTASWANNVNTASWAQSASHALNARTASWASNVNTASWANNVISSSFATTASFGPNIGNTNLTLTGNRILDFGALGYALRFTQGNSVTTNFNNTGVNITGSLTALDTYIYGASDSLAGKISIYEAKNNGGSYVGLSAPDNLSSDVNFILPSSTGSGDNYVLRDDGAGTLSFTNQVPTASLASRNLLTASVSSNIITFTKGDGSTFPITVNTGSGGTSFTGNQYEVAYFSSSNTTPEGALYITAYPIQSEGVALRVGRNEPTETSSSGSHILKDNRELFTNAKLAAASEPFVLLGFGGKGNVDLTATDNYEHPGINNYSDFTPGKVYNGSLKLRNTLYGIQDVDGNTKLVADGGFVAKPSSPGFLLGQGGFYIFDSASMQFNASGGLISPVTSASVRLTLATDSSSLSIAVGKNNLTDVLYISRSGNDARIAVGGNYRTPRNTLDISGSLRVFTSVTASIISASSITSSLFGTSSWAINALTASFLPVATYNITASWAQSASNAINARTASFVNNLNQDLSITGAVILSGSPSPELRVIGDTQFTGSVGSTGGFTGSLLGTSSWATNAQTASFLPVGTYNVTASWAQSASNAINARTASFLPVGTYNITSSWAQSASNAVNAQTASFLSVGTYNITASWAQSASNAINARTASFLPIGTYNITSSWAQSASNAVNSQTASFLPVATYNITASWAQSASNAVNARTASFLPVGTYNITSSWATNALTASFVNTLNQNLIITGTVSIGTGSIGPNENTLTLGARDTANEGGQLGLNAPGGTYTSASFIDLYQNRFRILRGTNVSSDAEYFSINLHTGQVGFSKYTGSGAFPGSAAGYLAVDTAGNIITATGTGGSTTPGGSNTQIQYNNSNAFGGVPTLTYDGTTLRATGSFTGSLTGSLFGTASWALNVVGGGGGGATFPYTGSAIISGSLIVTGSTAITGGFDALGTKGSRIQLGTYNVGYDIAGFDTFFITGAGLIVSGNMPDQNHHNFLKIGNIEMVDVNTALTSNEFLIHNVNTLRITSGADGGNITTGNQLLKIGGGEFYVYRAGSGDSAGIIQSTANSTTIRDTVLTLFGQSGSYFYIPGTNEITTLNGTDYLMGFANDPSSPPSSLTYKIKADKFIWVTGSNQIISSSLTVTGSLRTNFLTASGLNYPSTDGGEFSFIQTDGNGNLSLQYVDTLYETVYNGEATQLARGTPVYISGSQGANSIAYRADAGIPSKMPVVYVIADNIDPADTGRAIALGLITGVNTTGYPGGTEIYVGVGGGWTSTRPTGSAIVQVLGYVTKEGAGGQGVILNPGPANLPNLPSGSVWLGNSGSVPIAVSSASLFVNSASFALTASFVKNAQTASYILNAISSSFASTASYVLNAVSSSFSSTASFTPNAIITASVNSNIITFTKGSGTTFNITVNTGSGGGGGVTINNNVSGYVVTATGTANTLNGESGLTFDGTTLTVANNAIITAIDVRNDPSTTIGQYAPGAHMGRDWPAAGGPALTAGNIVYFSGSSQWANAQANATGSSTRVLGVVTDNADPNEIVLQGTVTINTDLATYQVGQPVYLSPISGGRVTNIPPSSSGHVARYVGWVVDTSRDQIYFNPDFTYIQL